MAGERRTQTQSRRRRGDAAGDKVADIIGLNGSTIPRDAGDSRPALEALAQRLGMHFVFGPCALARRAKHAADAYATPWLAAGPSSPVRPIT